MSYECLCRGDLRRRRLKVDCLLSSPFSDMGVLMSRKQQVEKVQKCNAVVSAFKEGLKDRPPQARCPESTGEPEDKPVERPAATPAARKEDDEDQPQEGSKQASASQQVSSSIKEEDSRINQEAWSRLRDGKGVEPEDLSKAKQLARPAFVRPKREPGDDQPVNVELGQREQVRWPESTQLTGQREEMWPLRYT
ncbi:hypothetical protein GN956_G27144, partial [Arapaima gigas]